MKMTICERCGGLVIEEDGKYLCAVCGEEYGLCEKPVDEQEQIQKERMSAFFRTASLEKLRRISRGLADRVYVGGYVLVAIRSNGQYYQEISQEFYQGMDKYERIKAMDREAAATKKFLKDWQGIERFCECGNCLVGLTADGEMQTTSQETWDVLERIKQEVSRNGPLRMRQVVELKDPWKISVDYWDRVDRKWRTRYQRKGPTFVGVNIHGKVFVYNPFDVFDLNKETPEGVQRCGEIMKELRSWPPIKYLHEWDYSFRDSNDNIIRGEFLCGITEDGGIRITDGKGYYREKQWLDELQSWDEVEDITWDGHNWIALKKDGMLQVNENASVLRNGVKELSGIVQISGRSYLTENGELFRLGVTKHNYFDEILESKKLAEGVVAIISEDYHVRADGQLYRWNRDTRAYEPVDGLQLFGRIEMIEEEWAAADSVQKRINSLNAKLYELEGRLLPLKATVESDESKWKLFRSREHEANRQTLQAMEEECRNLLEQIRVLTEEPPHLDD